MEKYGIEVNKSTNFLRNQLMDAMLDSMLKYRNKRLIPTSARSQNVELENSEIETIRHIAGFIVFSLKKTSNKYNPMLQKYQFYLIVEAHSQTMTSVLPWKNTQMLG